MTQRSIEDICENILELLCAVPQYMAWNVVWACCFAGVDGGECPLHTFSRQAQSLVVGGGWSFLRYCVVYCLEPCKEAVEVVEQRDVVVAGL